MMTLDICPPYGIDEDELIKFTNLSIDWAKRGKYVKEEEKGYLFAVIQGGLNLYLRMKVVEELEKENFPGYGIGGLSIGEPWEKTKEFLKNFVKKMPDNKQDNFMGLWRSNKVLWMTVVKWRRYSLIVFIQQELQEIDLFLQNLEN